MWLKRGSGDGSGYGSGYGSGTGTGPGTGPGPGPGYGYGYGSGSGSGSGSGTGTGYGYGYGSGYGSGSGDGYGCGDGSGSDDGYGSGLKRYNNNPVYYIDSLPTLIYSLKGNVARAAIINNDLSLNDCFVAKVNSYFAHGSTIENAVFDARQKALANSPESERIAAFRAEFPETDIQYPVQKLYEWHSLLTGSCEFGKNQFIREKNIDLDSSMTLITFRELVKDKWGGSIVKKAIKH